MIDALITGKLSGSPTQKNSKTGNPFAVAKVLVPTKDGESLFCNVICFDASATRGLLALNDKDAVSMTGSLSVSTYEAKDGTTKPSLSLVCTGLLTPYHIKKKRDAIQQQPD